MATCTSRTIQPPNHNLLTEEPQPNAMRGGAFLAWFSAWVGRRRDVRFTALSWYCSAVGFLLDTRYPGTQLSIVSEFSDRRGNTRLHIVKHAKNTGGYGCGDAMLWRSEFLPIHIPILSCCDQLLYQAFGPTSSSSTPGYQAYDYWHFDP
eukprot:3908983-Rhodomonas_salina.1